MMEFPEARKAAVMLAALAEPTRLRIVFLLARQSHNVGELAEAIGIPMVNMSHHLGVMRQAGVLEDEKDGRKVIYRFRPGVFTAGDGVSNLGILAIGPYRVILNIDGGDLDSKTGKRKPSGK
jgi:DNA-binding transcriptional ArsR family regulator